MTDGLERSVELTRKAAAAYGRPDLVDKIDLVAGTAGAVPLVVVAGEFNSGKSSLINAITSDTVCPSGAEHATAVSTLVHLGGPRGALAISGGDDPPVPLEVTPEALVPVVTDATDQWEGIERVEVRLGAIEGPGGFALVDTPGAGGWTGRLGVRAIGWIPLAAAVLVTHDGASPLTASEMELIELCHRLCPSVALVVTRTDLHPAWGEIVADSRARLADRDLAEVPVLPVSARLAGSPDATAIMRSGIDELLDWTAGAAGAAAPPDRLQACCLAIVADLETDLAAQGDRLLEADAEAAEAPPGAAASKVPWQTALGDAISDLGSAVDARWKRAGQEMIEASELRLAEIDPSHDWAIFETWLRQDSAKRGAEAFVHLQSGLDELGSALAASLFADAADLGMGTSADDTDERFASLDLDLRLQAVAGLGTRGFAALRASYSGMSLAGMMAGVAGLSLAGPALLVFGVAMSAKSIRDDRRKQAEQRRQQAVAAARRYIDDVVALVQQDLRDGLRTGQRNFRDRCVLLAGTIEERRRQRHPRDLTEAERAGLMADLATELERLDKLRRRLEQVSATEAGDQ